MRMVPRLQANRAPGIRCRRGASAEQNGNRLP
jgi:hypothetical protein